MTKTMLEWVFTYSHYWISH